MKALQQFLPSKSKSNSLFMILNLGFLTIIILLVTFHFVTISISSDQVRAEIIKYNTQNLNNTMENYEKHFKLVKRKLLSFMIHDEVKIFRKEQRYIKFPEIQQEIQHIVSNPLHYIHDIILYNHSNSQILDSNKSTDAETMFTIFMQDEVFTPMFWEEQFSEPFKERMLTATAFVDHTFPLQPSLTRLLIPVVFKIHDSDSLYSIVLLDARRMFQKFHVSPHENLIILDGEYVLYSNEDDSNRYVIPSLPKDGREYILTDGHYYFYKTGAESGLTYINQIPMEDISAQISMKATLLFILTLAIGISIIVAWLFIRTINNPLQQVILSLKNINTKQPVHSRIKEFRTISHLFTKLAKEREKTSYVNHFKEIHQSGTAELNFSKQPFVLLLFDFVFKNHSKEARETKNKWYLYVREFIDLTITLKYEKSLVFQIEKNQVICLIYLEKDHILMEILEKIKATLDLDQSVGYATIAVSSQYQHSSELTKAYEEVLDSLHRRPYGDETTIIRKSARQMLYSGFSIEQEQQFDIHLREGNASLVMKTVQKVLDRLKQQKTYAVEVEIFAKSVIDKCLRLLSTQKLIADEQQHFHREVEKIKSCYTFEELESFLQDFINQVCNRINEEKKRVVTDHVVDYISQYVEAHYDQEIYLEDLADRLKMSSGYLSTYFKHKTGDNFIDFLNRFRITKAQELLDATDKKVKEIAQESGYQNINSFNRMFKKFTGITPGKYRKRKIT